MNGTFEQKVMFIAIVISQFSQSRVSQTSARLSIVFLTVQRMSFVLTSAAVVLFSRLGTIYFLLNGSRYLWRNNSISFLLSFVIIQFRRTIKNPVQKREIIPSRFSIKIQVGIFVFSEQNKLFQWLHAAGCYRYHRSYRKSGAQ